MSTALKGLNRLVSNTFLIFLFLSFSFSSSVFSQVFPEASDVISEKELFDQGLRFLEKADLDNAVEAFRSVLQQNPNNLLAHLNLGIIYNRSGKRDLAIESFKAAERLRPDLLQPPLLLTQVYVLEGRIEEAEQSVKRAIANDASNAQSHYLLGLIYRDQNRFPEAIFEFETVLTLKGDEASRKGAQTQIDEFKNRAELHLNRGLAFFKADRFEQSLEEFEQVLVHSARNYIASYYTALIHKLYNRLEKAETALLAALQEKPDLTIARLVLGETYQLQGRVREAILAYQAIRDEALDPNSPEVAVAKQKLSQMGETPEIGEKITEHLKKGVAFIEEKAFESAELEFHAVLKLIPQNIVAHFSLGLIAIQKKEIQEAESLFLKAVEIDPNHFLSLMQLGAIYETRISGKNVSDLFDDKRAGQRQAEIDKAIQIYERALAAQPQNPTPLYRIAVIHEETLSYKAAIASYKKVLVLKSAEENPVYKIAQAKVDEYEKRYNVTFNDAFISYDSNTSQNNTPLSEVKSNLNLGLAYFFVKTNRFRLPLQVQTNHLYFHRQQTYLNNESLSVSFITTTPSQLTLVQGYTLRYGFQGGTNRANESLYKSDIYNAQILMRGRFPTLTTLSFDYIENESFTIPFLDATRQIAKLSLDQDLSVGGFYFGSFQLAYGYADDNILANDLANRSQSLSLSYRIPLTEKLTSTVQLTGAITKFRNPDSTAQVVDGLVRYRRNEYTSWSLGFTYRLQPGLILYANFSRDENRSNLVTARDVILELLANGGSTGVVPELLREDSVLRESNQAPPLGSYQQNVVSFGLSYATDLRVPAPQWSGLGKRLNVALLTGYYRPSLKELDQVMADPALIISQDPNSLIPSNPDFRSEDRNLFVPEIEGDYSSGVEVEWELSPKHALVFSLLQWQNASFNRDDIPLLLDPNRDPIIVPRSTRYNLSINQFLLGWRYSFWSRPEKGRLFFNFGLLGAALSDFTIDSLVQVENPPAGFQPIASFGSMEARGSGFVTRFGMGGEYFLTPWFSFGLNAAYVFGNITKLTIERDFPADFQGIPPGLPGIVPSPCFRQVDERTVDEVVQIAVCEQDLEVDVFQRRSLRIRLDGYAVDAALRFHFGKAAVAGSLLDRFLNGDSREAEASLWKTLRANLSVNGSLQNETAYRIFEPVTFTKNLYLLRLNTHYSFSSRFHLTTNVRTFYDAIYDLVDIDTISPRRFPNTVLTQIPQNPSSEEVASVNIDNSRDVEIVKRGFEFREIFLDINTKKVDLRLGRQIVRWGVIEGARVVDELNPFDFSEFILREVEDRFIPLMMVRTKFYPGNYTFDLVWITEVEPHKPAPAGSEFEQFEILPGFVPPESFLDSSLNLKDKAFENTEVGGRLIGNFSGWELSVSGLYTWDDFPSSFRVIQGNVDNPFDNTIETTFTPELKRITVIGTTLSKSFGKVVLNSEFSYTYDKFFGTRLEVGGLDPGIQLGEAQRDYIKYGLGFDFSLYNIDFSTVFLEQRIFDWQPAILQDEVDSVVSLFLRKSFSNDRMGVQLLTLYFLNENDFLLRPRLDASITDAVKARFGGDFFIGDRGGTVGEFDFIGFFNDSDRLYLEVMYSF